MYNWKIYLPQRGGSYTGISLGKGGIYVAINFRLDVIEMDYATIAYDVKNKSILLTPATKKTKGALPVHSGKQISTNIAKEMPTGRYHYNEKKVGDGYVFTK